MSKNLNNVLITSKAEDILFYLEYNSDILFNVVKEINDGERFVLIRKYLTHSDLATRGKVAKKEKDPKSFILYYDSTKELKNSKKLPTAAQSCIRLPEEFYLITGINSYSGTGKRQHRVDGWNLLTPIDANKDYDFDDFDKIRILNDKSPYSEKVSKQLKDFDKTSFFYEQNDNYLRFDSLTIAAHGLGTKKNELLSYYRAMTFKGDVLNILIDKTEKTLYLFFERNEKYYQLLSKITDTLRHPPIWADYTEEDKKAVTLMLYSLSISKADLNNVKIEIISNENLDVAKILQVYYNDYSKTIQEILQSGEKPKYRWYQKKWKEVLIKLDEATFNEKGFAICAISGLKGHYEKLGKFFIASHIKPYARCIEEEDYNSAFDPYNGFILSASIDALFDQFLISIDRNGRILTNKVVKTINQLKKLMPKNKMDSQYLTEQRIDYLKLHKIEFDKKNY